MDTAVIVALIAAAASVVGAVYTARTTRRSADAQERAVIRQIEAGAYQRARDSYEGAITRLQAEIDRQAAQINALQRQVARLIKQVREAGLVPVTSSEDDHP